uniref:carcinoembryonic antigen-related cell adhesion molecule 5-like n=1 Tax=Ictidomys tridecemlineatus TaxID=43179 RepID=UPI001A9D4C74|nr:carcinoembryonic antigen-related cell adhesion molecule 5-like [Ictidomys tridecemlineatus]
MQPASACPCRGGIPWQGVLLAVSLLTFWNPHPTAQLTIEPVPSDVAEGRDVLLLVHNVSGNAVGYSWYRGQITDRSRLIVSYSNLTHSATPGLAFSGRETVYPNGSLLFVNLKKEDTGFYTLQTTTDNFDAEVATGEFRVHEKLPKPNITINNSQPMEGEDSLALMCEPEIHYATYLWKIKNQTIPDGDRLKLSNNNRTLTLFNVTRNDTGPYECETQNPVSASHSDPLTLSISYGPDAPIINPPDSHFRPGTNLHLSCHADSNPPAQYSWSLNGRPLESTQELSIPNLSTNNSGSYVCVAHNSVTNLNRTTTKNIADSGKWTLEHKPVTLPHLTASNTRVAEGDSVQLTCVPTDTEISIQWLFNNKILQLTDRMQLSSNKSILTIHLVLKMDEGEYQCQVSNPISSQKSNPIILTVIVLVSQLTFWNLHPMPQLTIEPVPFDAAEGTDVLFILHNVPENAIVYNWFKGINADFSLKIISYLVPSQMTIPGPAFSGGEKIYSNGSLLLQKVTLNDTGFYTLRTVTADAMVEFETQEFHVHRLVAQPSLRATNTEPHSVAMTCFSDDLGISITWIFNSQTLQLTDRMQLSPDHRTLSIDPVRQEDAGEYQWPVTSLASESTSPEHHDTAKVPLTAPPPCRREDPRPPCGGRRWHRDWGPGRGGSGGRSGVFPAPHKNWKGRVQQGLRDPCTPASPHGQGPSYSSIFLVSPPTFLHTGDPPKQAQGRVTVNPYTAQTPPFMWDQDKSPVPGHKSAVPIYQVSVVSLLTFWNPQPTVQLTTEPVPFNAAEGTDVLLLVHNASQNIIGYNWFKGKTTDGRHEIVSYIVSIQVTILGSASSGGEKIYSNGSLLLQKVTQNHTGFYTLQTVTANARVELATGEFHVHSFSTGLVAQPSLRATNTEPHSVAMTCFSGDLGISITWIFNSQTLQLTDRMQLSPDHRTLSIDPVRQEDAGEYQCEASTPASSTRSDRYRLAVISEERTPGLPVGAVAGIVTGVLVGVALVAALGCFLLHTRTGRYPGFPHLIPPR